MATIKLKIHEHLQILAKVNTEVFSLLAAWTTLHYPHPWASLSSLLHIHNMNNDMPLKCLLTIVNNT